MRGPSDAFFRDIVQAVGGELQEKLPDIEKRRSAAKMLGQNVSLAQIASKMGLIDQEKLDELEKLETGDAPRTPSAAQTPAATKTPSAGKTPAAKTPSASKTPAAKAPSAAKAPAKPAPAKPAPPPPPAEEPEAEAAGSDEAACTVCGAGMSLADYAESKGICPTCTEKTADDDEEPSESGTRGTKRRARAKAAARGPARGAPPASNSNAGVLVIVLAIVIAGLLVAVAVVWQQQQQQQPPPVQPSPSARPTPTPAPVVVDPSPSPSPATTEPGQETDRQRQSRLTKLAMEGITLASKGDRTGAKRRLAKIRVEAVLPADAALVKEAEKQIDEALKAADHPATDEPTNLDADGHRKPPTVDMPDDPGSNPPPPEPTNPAEAAARTAYRDFRKKLDPLLGHFDIDGARALLAQAPALVGSPADDLDDDKQIPDALDKFLQCAARGAKKTVGSDQDFHTAAGARIRGKVTEVDGINVTVAGSGGEQLVKMSELVTDELLSVASQGLTRDSQQDYALGRGLVLYYAGSMEDARAQLGAAVPPLAKKILDRIGREGAPYGSKAPKGPGKPVAPKPQPVPTDTPAPPDDPGGAGGADVAAVQAKVHVKVADFGDGTVGLRYGMTDEGDALDFDSKGCDRFEVTNTEKPGTQNKPIRCLECGINSYEDIGILNKVAMKGDFDISFDFYANYLHPETSNLVIVAGVDKKRWIGALFGQQLVKSDGKHVTKGTPESPDFSRFATARDCQVKMVRRGDKLTLWFNGAERGTMTGAAGFDGRWGILAHNLRIAIRRFEFRGCPDLTKK